MDINDIRRANLRELIAAKYQGNRSAFCRAIGKNVNLINLILTSNPELRRSIGEKLARSIEHASSLPTGWLDVNRDSRSGDVVSVQRIRGRRQDADMIPEALYVGSKWLSRAAPEASSTDNLRLWHAHDDTMSPTIEPGDVVLVDNGSQQNGAGVYLIEHHGQQEVRRLQLRPDGAVIAAPDNKLYDAVTLDAKHAKAITILGRVVAALRHTRI